MGMTIEQANATNAVARYLLAERPTEGQAAHARFGLLTLLGYANKTLGAGLRPEDAEAVWQRPQPAPAVAAGLPSALHLAGLLEEVDSDHWRQRSTHDAAKHILAKLCEP